MKVWIATNKTGFDLWYNKFCIQIVSQVFKGLESRNKDTGSQASVQSALQKYYQIFVQDFRYHILNAVFK